MPLGHLCTFFGKMFTYVFQPFLKIRFFKKILSCISGLSVLGIHPLGFPSDSAVKKNPPAMQEMEETRLGSLVGEDSLEEGMATHSSILAWRIPWMKKPGTG